MKTQGLIKWVIVFHLYEKEKPLEHMRFYFKIEAVLKVKIEHLYSIINIYTFYSVKIIILVCFYFLIY